MTSFLRIAGAALTAAAGLLAFAGTSHASLLGDEIHGTSNFPTASTVAEDLGTQKVTTGGNVFTDAELSINFDVFPSQINFNLFNSGDNGGLFFGPFNGDVFADNTNRNIIGAVVGSSNFAFNQSDISFTANSVSFNFAGLTYESGDSASVNLLFAPPVVSGVPEPATWAMMILGFGGLGFFAYRKARNGSALPMMAA